MLGRSIGFFSRINQGEGTGGERGKKREAPAREGHARGLYPAGAAGLLPGDSPPRGQSALQRPGHGGRPASRRADVKQAWTRLVD
ncbi:hypothetical protein B2K_26935 [Paenibacillus mucilaginosus K02]|uniref:Uncharacterized protein n=1 Tax=Paenibacillus mucilaginosus K02 TaxID=997761 RepID=I0BPI6_9BACL|nr:hypothetical protein B2K_26935 [Paenibacillus mucilaginosus K02]